jgi:hypothetical protein
VAQNTYAASNAANLVTCRGVWSVDPANKYYLEWDGKRVINYVVIKPNVPEQRIPVRMTKIDEAGRIQFGTKNYTVIIDHAPEAGKGVNLIFSGIDLSAFEGLDETSPRDCKFHVRLGFRRGHGLGTSA